MREIKFRGKSLATGKWAYGSLLQINGDAYIYPDETGDLGDIDFGAGFVEVLKESVGQYIGQEDINGVEIYSNSSVKYHYQHDPDSRPSRNGAINWHQSLACFAVEDMECQPAGFPMPKLLIRHTKNLEVIR